MICGKKGLEEVGFIIDLESEVSDGKKCMYFVCDFNGRWLNDMSLLCCIVIILSVGSIISYVK